MTIAIDWGHPFWRYVSPEPNTGCWLWAASLDKGGYGQTYCRGPAPAGAHRVAWEAAHGPIPAGLGVLHRCDQRSCVNPRHLFLGTAAENSADMVRKGRQARGARSGPAKLSDASVTEMRALYAAGAMGCRRLAKRFGVDLKTAQDVVRARSWRHLL